MGFASHLGPWLIGTVKNTGSSIAQSKPDIARNMGATVAFQQTPDVVGNTVSIPSRWYQMVSGGSLGANFQMMWLPAGSHIMRIYYQSVVGANGTTPGFDVKLLPYNSSTYYTLGSVAITTPTITTTLAADITAGFTGNVNIATSSTWPSNGYLFCQNECLSFSKVSNTVLNITGRGAAFTTAAAHTSGTTISACVPQRTEMTINSDYYAQAFTSSIGTINAPICVTWTGTGSTIANGYLLIEYVVRDKSGSIIPAYQTV